MRINTAILSIVALCSATILAKPVAKNGPSQGGGAPAPPAPQIPAVNPFAPVTPVVPVVPKVTGKKPLLGHPAKVANTPATPV
jgi:hypothetical protein